MAHYPYRHKQPWQPGSQPFGSPFGQTLPTGCFPSRQPSGIQPVQIMNNPYYYGAAQSQPQVLFTPPSYPTMSPYPTMFPHPPVPSFEPNHQVEPGMYPQVSPTRFPAPMSQQAMPFSATHPNAGPAGNWPHQPAFRPVLRLEVQEIVQPGFQPVVPRELQEIVQPADQEIFVQDIPEILRHDPPAPSEHTAFRHVHKARIIPREPVHRSFRHENAFAEWLQKERMYQNWRIETDDDSEKRAAINRKSREKAAAKLGKPVPKAIKSTPRSLTVRRRLYLCDHGRNPEAKQNLANKSEKVNCGARIVAKTQTDGTIDVELDERHTGHDPHSLESINESWMTLGCKQWLYDRVDQGLEKPAITNLVQLNREELIKYGSNDNDDHVPLDPTEDISFKLRMKARDIRVAIHTYHDNMSRKFNGRTLSIPAATPAWLGHISADAGWTMDESFLDGSKRSRAVAFASEWQLKQLHLYGKTVCMDATHNVIHDPELGDMYLITLLVKNVNAGRGIPAVFMMTNSGSKEPLVRLLSKLKIDFPGFRPSTFVIDCSATENAAIQDVFPQARVLFCLFHFFKAIRGNIASKFTMPRNSKANKGKADRIADEIMRVVVPMTTCSTEAEFDELLAAAELKWSSDRYYSSFHRYFQSMWISRKYEWGGPWRQHDHSGMETTNYVESWHNVLKTHWLGTKRRINMPAWICMATTKITLWFEQQCISVGRNLQPRRSDKVEAAAAEQCATIPDDELEYVVDLENGQLQVQSFSDPNIWWNLARNPAKNIVSCACPSFKKAKETCKHILLALRYLVRIEMPARFAPEVGTVPQPHRASQIIAPELDESLQSFDDEPDAQAADIVVERSAHSKHLVALHTYETSSNRLQELFKQVPEQLEVKDVRSQAALGRLTANMDATYWDLREVMGKSHARSRQNDP